MPVLEKKFTILKLNTLVGDIWNFTAEVGIDCLLKSFALYLLKLFSVEQKMAKNQEVSRFYFPSAFTAKRRMLLEVSFTVIEPEIFQQSRWPRFTCISSEITYNFENSLLEALRVSKFLLGRHYFQFYQRLVISRMDVVQHSSVVPHLL